MPMSSQKGPLWPGGWKMPMKSLWMRGSMVLAAAVLHCCRFLLKSACDEATTVFR